MNILFCLTPKSEVDFVYDESSLNKTMQTLEKHNYYCVPLISKKGRYIGTITASDVLGCIRENFNLSIKESADFPVRNVNRFRDYKAANANTTMEQIVEMAIDQNFVPVVDDEYNFIGIITRKSVINWMAEKYLKNHPEANDKGVNIGGNKNV